MRRLEKSEYPTPALREIILNALVHHNYMGSPTQIRVYDSKINFWNEGMLPEGLTFEALKGFHTSRPRNLLITDDCFKGGFIDSWGRGTLKIYDACSKGNLSFQLLGSSIQVYRYKGIDQYFYFRFQCVAPKKSSLNYGVNLIAVHIHHPE